MTDGVWVGLDIGGSKVQGVAIDTAGIVLAQVRLGSTNGAVGVAATAGWRCAVCARFRPSPAARWLPLAWACPGLSTPTLGTCATR